MKKEPSPLEFCFYRVGMWFGLYVALFFLLTVLADALKIVEFINSNMALIDAGMILLAALIMVIFDKDIILKLRSGNWRYKLYFFLFAVFIAFIYFS